MKKAFILTIIAVYCSFVNSEALHKSVRKKVEVTFNSQFNFNKLVLLKDSLQKNYKITIDYRSLQFNKEGGLTKIYFTVNCNDGYSGEAKADNLNRSDRFGFIRDYSNDAEPFVTGFLPTKFN